MQRNRRKGGRIRRHRSELDWFAEDPWAETDGPAATLSFDDWQQGFEDLIENDLDDVDLSEDEESDEDVHDGWGPIRPRRGRPVRR
jgi:hypothetical protein